MVLKICLAVMEDMEVSAIVHIVNIALINVGILTIMDYAVSLPRKK